MAAINYGRLVLGSLVAGVVANVCDFLTGTFIMATDMQRLVQRLNLNPDIANSSAVGLTWLMVDFVYGALIVWTYVSTRPRLGPGPTTAVAAGLVAYLSATSVLYGFQAMGVFTPDLFFKSAVLSLVTTMLAALAGAAVYKEER
jgi:hypothetical protein